MGWLVDYNGRHWPVGIPRKRATRKGVIDGEGTPKGDRRGNRGGAARDRNRGSRGRL